MKLKNLARNLKIYSYVIIALLVVLLARLAVVQLFHNEVYQTQAKENRIRLLSIKPSRGEIYASDGKVLAANKLVYTLTLNISDDKQQQENTVNGLAAALHDYYPEITAESIHKMIATQSFRLYEPLVIMRDIPWDLVVKLEENRQLYPGMSINVEPLRYYPNGNLAGHVLGYIHSINAEELEKAEEGKYNINSLVGKSGIEKQYEKELRGTLGARRVEVDASGRPIRDLVTLEPQPGNNLTLTIDMDLQKVMEKSLTKNMERLQKDYPKAKVGSAVVLNVKTGEVLAMASLPALNPDDFKGNISPELAAYYFPQGDKYDPLDPGAATNRAIQSGYPPGSTFKPVTGMAALEKGEMDPLKDLVNCQGRYWLAPYIKCTGVHGNSNYYRGMAVSCNTYFQEMGRRAGKDEIIRVASEFGLGSKTGIDLPGESSGLLPTPEWKKEINSTIINSRYKSQKAEIEQHYNELISKADNNKERTELQKEKQEKLNILESNYQIKYQFDTKWQQYDTFNMSIGQGSNNYTVIQLADYVAAIANGGKLMRPHIMKRITDHEGKVLQEAKPELMRKIDIKASTIAETKRAMWEVTRPGGTAYHLFYSFPEAIKVGAKTGTAETGRAGDNHKRDFHGVFIAFAPLDDPEIAFAGVVEYGYSGGGSAGYVCRDVFEQYFGIKDHLAADDKKTGNNSNINNE